MSARPATAVPAVSAAQDSPEQDSLDGEAQRLASFASSRRGDDPDQTLARRAYAVAEACGSHPLTSRPYYTPEDVVSWLKRAVEMGCALPRISPSMIVELFQHKIIPNARLRDRYLELKRDRKIVPEDKLDGTPGQCSPADIAVAVGELNRGKGSGQQVERLLGLQSKSDGQRQCLRLFVPYETGVKFADALGLDYHDLGV
jgi:hypothetical protein